MSVAEINLFHIQCVWNGVKSRKVSLSQTVNDFQLGDMCDTACLGSLVL